MTASLAWWRGAMFGLVLLGALGGRAVAQPTGRAASDAPLPADTLTAEAAVRRALAENPTVEALTGTAWRRD